VLIYRNLSIKIHYISCIPCVLTYKHSMFSHSEIHWNYMLCILLVYSDQKNISCLNPDYTNITFYVFSFHYKFFTEDVMNRRIIEEHVVFSMLQIFSFS